MTQTTLSFGPQVELLLIRAHNRQIERLETIVRGTLSRYVLVVGEDESTLRDAIEDRTETHSQNIIYLNGTPQGVKSHDQWLKESTIRLALWCQDQALDIALQHLRSDDIDILRETCADIIDHVEHCSRIDMVRWLHWGTTADTTSSRGFRSTRKLFEAFLDCIDKFGCSDTLLNTLFQYSERWLGTNISKLVDEWVNHHPNTTKFHRWLRRYLHHYTNAPKPHWISHLAPFESGWISAGVHRDALLTHPNGFIHRNTSGKWRSFKAHVPQPVTATFGLWDGSWMLICNEQVTKITRNSAGSLIEKQPILTVSRRSPTIGCFQGRPYVIGGEENDHTVCELWDRREKRWIAFHMHHDHHLANIQIIECVGGIEVIGYAGTSLEHWRLMFIGDHYGEWELLDTIDDTSKLLTFTLIGSGIVALQVDETLQGSLVKWSDHNNWEYICTIPADQDVKEWSMYVYENNQVVISRQEHTRTVASIIDVTTGEPTAPLLELHRRESPSFCTLADGTLLCCTKHECHSIFV